MKKYLTFMVLLGFTGVVFSDQNISCESAEECNRLGTLKYKNNEYNLALKYFLKQVDVAEYTAGLGERAKKYLAYNNVALVYFKLNQPLMAKAWVDLVLRSDPNNKSAIYNQSLFNKSTNIGDLTASFQGTYGQYAGKGQWSTLKLQPINSSEIKVELYIQRYGVVPSADFAGPAAYGELKGIGRFINDTLYIYYNNREDKPICNVQLEIHGKYIVADQNDFSMDCSFGGSGVYAKGDFIMLNDKIPNIK